MSGIKNVLVLGGGGFIGSRIVQDLMKLENYSVTAADAAFPRISDCTLSNQMDNGRLRRVTDDYTTAEAFQRLGGDFDQVYMMAAVVGVNRALRQPRDVIRTNTLLTMQTLEWLNTNPTKRLLFASSSENYAATTDEFEFPVPTSESVALCISDIRHPRFSYAVTKIHGESAFLHSAPILGYDCTIVRYQNIIGPDMGFRHAIPHIVQRFAAGEPSPFKVYGHDQTRSFCFVSDAVAGTIGAMNCPEAAGEIYHIGNVEEITMATLTREIGRLMNYAGEYEPAITYPGSVARRCPDIRKSVEHFGYAPAVDWRTAVSRTVDWYRDYFLSGRRPESDGFAPPSEFVRGAP